MACVLVLGLGVVRPYSGVANMANPVHVEYLHDLRLDAFRARGSSAGPVVQSSSGLANSIRRSLLSGMKELRPVKNIGYHTRESQASTL